MTAELPQRIDHDAPVCVISVAAQLAGMHPQTLRTYDRMGLVSPRRTAKRGRRYSARNIAQLRLIQRLSQDEGVNLAGIKRIIGLEQLVGDLQQRLGELEQELAAAYRRIAELETMGAYPGRDLIPTNRSSTALVVWRPRRSPDR